MDRNREARRTTMAANGLSRRRHRTNSLRDSPEEDGPVEMQEPARLRDRGTGKKDRDHRERDRERDRDRERERDRLGRSSKRRRGDRMMHSSNREDGEDSTEESVNDEEDDEDDDGAGVGSVRMLPLNPSSLSSNHRKSFPPAKVFRAPPTLKAADEMIGVSVPRKARSASTKRSHECWASGGGIMQEQIHRQASTSPVRTGVAVAVGMGPTPSPASPSSSNASLRKKAKPNGPKLRPPKSSSKSSSAQDEIEIEIAEVLYGMRQPQGPTKQEIMATDSMKFDSRDTNKSSSDKSRVSSPISNSQSAPPLCSSVPPQNSSSSVTPLSAVAPKRKKPRPVKYDDESPSIFTVRNSPISSMSKAESDQPSKIETCSSNLDKNAGSTPENGGVSCNIGNSLVVPAPSEPQPESIKLESNISSDSKPLTGESEKQDVGLSKEPQSPKKESSVHKLDDEREDMKATKANQAISESEKQREEKFQIDLMAPPPPLRSSPERDVEVNFVARDAKPMVIDAEAEVKPMTKEEDKKHRMSKEDAVTVENDKVRATAGEAEANKPVSVHKERSIDLHLDLEKADRDSGNGNMATKRHNQNIQRQQQPNSEKTIQSSSLPLPMSVPSWPGSLPPMGYMAPLQGVVSMDGTTVSSAAMPPPHLLFNQPRPKRCATHYYIARNISYHQQLAKMNPFWPAAAGSASIYGAKHCNLNVVPSAELHGNVPGRAANSSQDKGHGHAMFPGYLGKEKGSQAASNMDNAQRKQILLQQALPPGPPSNILHAPAFIFPLNQQQAAAAASVRPGSVKPPHATGNGASSCTPNSSPATAAGTGAAAAPTMSFSYPNMPGNETQYLAILQNNGYSFPIPAHVGGPPPYRGTHAQALPFFSGSFYSSQMLHPSQLQHQQLPQSHQQSQQQGHQNASISSGSSSSQKHLQNQQQKANASNSNGATGGGSLHGFPASKSQSSQPLQNHHASHPARQIESEMGGEESPLTADSRLSRTTMSIYGPNFAMPMQPPNFALMTPGSVSGSGAGASVNASHIEKKHAQQHTGPKAGVETSQAFAMSFASINGSTNAPGIDLSSMAQNHPLLHSHSYQVMAAAAQVAQPKKTFRVSEEGKPGGDTPDDDRKAMTGKIPANIGQSIAFSRSDVSDPSISPITSNTVIDSSARTLNLGSAPSRASACAAINSNAASSQQQLQRNNQQQQLLKQHQFAAAPVAASRSKTPSTCNGSVYSDHLSSTSSMATKFPNPASGFPQNLVPSGSNATQSPQWKNSARVATSQSPSPSMASTPSSSVKTFAQQQGRSQHAHTQISFAANQKSSPAPQGQPSGSTQSPSPPVMVGSPTTSVSKSAGSPRTTSTSTSNKVGQAAALSTQQPKNSQAMPTRKSSPVSGRNVPSILSSPQLTPGNGVKPQLPPQQQHQQQQISKQALQQAQAQAQAQLYFPSPFMHPQASQSNTSTPTTSSTGGFYLQRRGPEQQQQRQGSSGNPSNGMVPLGPSVVNTSTSDSSKLVVGAASSSMKGSGLPTQALLHPAQFAAQPSGNHHPFVHPGIPYVQAVPTPVQVKPTEQKQPAGE